MMMMMMMTMTMMMMMMMRSLPSLVVVRPSSTTMISFPTYQVIPKQMHQPMLKRGCTLTGRFSLMMGKFKKGVLTMTQPAQGRRKGQRKRPRKGEGQAWQKSTGRYDLCQLCGADWMGPGLPLHLVLEPTMWLVLALDLSG